MLTFGGQIIFKGHDHIYADEIVDGIHYTTCGRTCGQREKPCQWEKQEGFSDLYPHGFDSAQGYLRIHVSSERIEVCYIDIHGRVRGQYRIEG